MNNKAISVGISFVITLTPCLAEVTTDGSVGHALHLPGPNFHIAQDLGSLQGHNLFHSFSHFNLTRSESATFTGDNHIQNVISRVTGGELSNIDGTLKSEIGHAAFYFINPAGIVFGEHAQVDVPGAFYASTAGELRFADGGRFSALHPQGNTLSMTAPEAFGFLGKQTGTIAVNGADLVFKTGATAQLSAAHISMNKAKLTGEGMDLQLVAVGDTKQNVGVSAAPDHALQGNMALKNTMIDASGNGKGRIVVRAGDVTIKGSGVYADSKGNEDMPANQGIDMRVGKLSLDNTQITSDTIGAGNAGTVKISTQKELAIINGGVISSTTFAKGNAGNTDVKAGTIRVDGQGKGVFTGITSQAVPNSNGNSGTVKVTVQNELAIINGGEIMSSTFSKGNAGNIEVKAGTLRIDGQYEKIPTGIFSDSAPSSIGNAGTINVSVKDQLAINNAGQIRSNTFAKGNAGGVDVKAKNIRIDGKDSEHPTGIASEASSNSSGNAGMVKVIAKNELALINDGRISSSTFATGHGGHVDVKAENIRIDGKDSEHATGIAADTFAKGNAGDVDVKAVNILIDGQSSESFTGITSGAESNSSGNAGSVTIAVKDELVLINNGQIDSSTLTHGNAGKVTVSAGKIRIDGAKDPNFITGILSGSLENATGSPSSVNVTATKELSMNAGEISIRSDDFANYSMQTNPKLIVTAPHIELKNDSLITAESFGKASTNPIYINTSQLNLDNSAIKTTANEGDGGKIIINAKDWAQLRNSQITTSVASKKNGNGGNININSDVLVMDTGFIQANTNAKNARGGKINLNTKQLVASGGTLQRGGKTPLTFTPNSGINVVQAAAPDGVSGNVTISAPQLNIVGALAGINTPQLDLNRVGHDPCSNTARQSTLKQLGKGGIPLFNKGQDSYTIDRLLTKTPDRSMPTTHTSDVHATNHDCKPG